jgi:hypothetical protein
MPKPPKPPKLKSIEVLESIAECLYLHPVTVTRAQKLKDVVKGGPRAPSNLAYCLSNKYKLISPALSGRYISAHNFGEIADEIVRRVG